MNRITVQLEDGNPCNSGALTKLIINRKRELRSNFMIEDYARIIGDFDENAGEFAYFTSIIYACDRAIQRETGTEDRWTRSYKVQIPVKDPELWNEARDIIHPMLEFLTGDVWKIEFVSSPISLFNSRFYRKRERFINRYKIRGSVISLFSGGMDSLIGVINWLEMHPDKNILLSSTYDGDVGDNPTSQKQLVESLQAEYPKRMQRYEARIGLQTGAEDTNLRSRSLAFIGNAILAASFIGDNTLILIPENGAIAVNYPLTPARRGSLSTRTVHPYFIKLVRKLLSALGLRYQVFNPYTLCTKGEMMADCKNDELLDLIYTQTTSCGKRGRKMHWDNKQASQCGICVPCIFRRAAIHCAGFQQENYGYKRSSLSGKVSDTNSDISAVIDFIQGSDDKETIWRNIKSNGHWSYSDKKDYVSLIQRLRDEVSGWAKNIGVL